ncbi:MAG TPA: GNAT family N-acetyltransferase [Anaerolineales bacterium]|nr:GNAT family N-acetyltransferase [Anaerolineales bacterium]
MEKVKTMIRLLEIQDTPEIAAAFQQLGWNKPASQYERYLVEQELGTRNVYVAFVEERFAGYLTICWSSSYEPFQSEGIPEIVDFNVLPEFRRQGIGTQLMDTAEGLIGAFSLYAGIGVGMTPDYGAAQRLYVSRGYIPDGRGLHYRGRPIKYGQGFTVNDDLVLYLTKKLDST